jgi:hypothetical protein
VPYQDATGKHGIGIEIQKGDQVVMPAGWLKIAANPLKSTGQMTEHGLQWFSHLVFAHDLGQRRENLLAVINEMDDEYGEVLKNSPLMVRSGSTLRAQTSLKLCTTSSKRTRTHPSGGST